jgi:serine kinase of HPr protein (carbohydrate metabolism regulator)
MGPSGAGKSSIAAGLVSAGGQLLSDDAVALALDDGAPIAYAGSAVLRLRAAENERLSARARAALGQQASFVNDRHRYVSTSAPGAVPLGSVFLLERSADEPAVERLEVVDPFELIASTFNLSVRTPARLRRQLDVVSAIASGGFAHRLRVQPGIDATRLAEIVQEHLASLQTPEEQAAAHSGARRSRERPLEH